MKFIRIKGDRVHDVVFNETTWYFIGKSTLEETLIKELLNRKYGNLSASWDNPFGIKRNFWLFSIWDLPLRKLLLDENNWYNGQL